MVGSSRGRPNSGSTISASSTRVPAILILLKNIQAWRSPRLPLASLGFLHFLLHSADKHGTALSQRLRPPHYKHHHYHEPGDHHDHKDVRRQVQWIGGNRVHRDKHH